MATFGTSTFSDGPDEWISLSNEEWIGQLSMSNNWNHIRIGMLWAVTGVATIGSGNGFSIGLCSGILHPYNDAACTNFVGISCTNGLPWTSSGTNSWFGFTSGSGGAYFATSKVGASITQNATNGPDGVGMWIPSIGVGSTSRRGIIYVDITKGSPNYTIGVSMWTNGGGTATDFTVPNLLAGMTQNYGSISIGGNTLNVGNMIAPGLTVAASESNGIFDTVDIYSNFTNNPMQIYEVVTQKLA